jgi:hypothetical protein
LKAKHTTEHDDNRLEAKQEGRAIGYFSRCLLRRHRFELQASEGLRLVRIMVQNQNNPRAILLRQRHSSKAE